ncbi:putative calmodulin-binding domain containing protein [Tanacetum coccineum]
MNTLSEETPRVKSSGSSAGSSGKKRRRSIDITSSEKSSGEEVNNVPNYLRGSTGYCHDFCNYGKHHEHVKSAILINFKQTTVVDKEKVAKTVVPVEKKKTTTVAKVNPSADPKFAKPAEPVEVTKKDAALPSQKTQVMKRSLSTNGKAARNEPKMFQRSTSLVKPSPVTVNRDASAGSNNVIKEIASKLAESRKSKVKALVNAFETMISASKLAESRKSKVKALVDAFETVISLQAGKPSST